MMNFSPSFLVFMALALTSLPDRSLFLASKTGRKYKEKKFFCLQILQPVGNGADSGN